ncbi:hypothetical protein CAGGBEG34_30047 [Candidatus Glomeribacter gigasporarum BEG34]|uniref:Uncharacterized protein n=1 Tax=Candidatus Glomeribacter gigasporarum BEG34 TaxID=1070319 RepID=G2JBC9_9BURK|nr:antirestriction protein ArdA [Candidatus Glomeribacter gigasporarum]CCD30083.1 hypothetical protein CAGGBEG34_30047 [Candidatus Glomeribacter gigasporarum BEG34]
MTTIWDADMNLHDAFLARKAEEKAHGNEHEYGEALIEALMKRRGYSRQHAQETLETEYRGAFDHAADFAEHFVDSMAHFPDFLSVFIDYERLGKWLLTSGTYQTMTLEEKMHVFKR